jgi:methanogenic corrinoid protein MtbC1
MNELLQTLATCIERGKINAQSPYPPDMKGMDGADELTRMALESGIEPQSILNDGLMAGMNRVGERFRDRLIFVPDVLLAARAMSAAMEHLKPFFSSNELRHRGTFIICTVMGDLHDIGKKLVGMVAEGAGYEIVDLGTDVQPSKIIQALEEHPDAVVGLSALLTTTMINMGRTIAEVRAVHPGARFIVGGAPLTQQYADSIGADAYSPDPTGAVRFLESGV